MNLVPKGQVEVSYLLETFSLECHWFRWHYCLSLPIAGITRHTPPCLALWVLSKAAVVQFVLSSLLSLFTFPSLYSHCGSCWLKSLACHPLHPATHFLPPLSLLRTVLGFPGQGGLWLGGPGGLSLLHFLGPLRPELSVLKMLLCICLQ
jgi:hypothetical protein